MYKEIISLLMCPECKGDLELIDGKECCGEIVNGKLACSNRHHWNIRDGILDFQSKEQEIANRWFEAFIDENFEEKHRETRGKNPEYLKRITSKTFSKVVIHTNKTDSEYIIDAAADRDSLLKEFIMEVNPNTQMISTNLSFAILKYNRKEMKRLNKNAKVNYIACDVTKLPIKDSSIDLAVSYTGLNPEDDSRN